MHNPLDAALAALSSAGDAPAGAQSFLTWELRGVLAATGATPERFEFDGGCRLERPSGDAQGSDAAFIVAAGPADIGELVAAPRGPAAHAEWTDALRWLGGLMDAEFARLRAARETLDRVCGKSGLSPGGHRLRVYARARAWRRPGESPRSEIVFGLRLRCEIGGARGVATLDELAPAPNSFSWIERPELLVQSIHRECELHRVLANAPSAPSLRNYCGPVVLGPQVAGWLVHELGHSALEGAAGARAGAAGASVDDDPRAAPWPAGFTVDDAGHAATAITLWDSNGVRPDPPVARRRASIRNAAAPFLSFTRLIARPESVIVAPPSDIPFIVSARAGRFDPISGLIVLATNTVVAPSASGAQRADDLLLTVAADEAWSGLSPCAEESSPWQGVARCSRLGSQVAVMVGAQTVALNSVHLASGEGALRWTKSRVPTTDRSQAVKLHPQDDRTAPPCPSSRRPWSRVSPQLDKSAAITETLSGPRGISFSRGWERGGDVGPAPDRADFVAPTTPLDRAEMPSRRFGAWARELRDQVIAAAELPPDEVAVHLSRALVVESWPGDRVEPARREVNFARVLLGANPDFPRWARTAPLRAEGELLPAAWTDALGREVAAWRSNLPNCGGEPPFAPGDLLFLDAFAFSDLLRMAAESWQGRRLRASATVASPRLHIDDLGPVFPATPVDRDAEGKPVRPLPVVRNGRLCAPPRTREDEDCGRGRSTGSAVRASWRDLPRAGWRSLVVRASEQLDQLPDRGWRVSRIIALPGGAVLGAGCRVEAGVAQARWGLTRMPGPDWWLRGIVSFVGGAVLDATGLPVSTPGAVIHPGDVT